jgi:undecaprenyl-diphosphatase
MSELIKVILLGIVQGITEFLPISSTGHLIVTSAALDFRGSIGGTFEIFIQLGSVLAVIAYYRADLLRQIRTVRSDRGVQRLWLAIVVAAIPASLVGFAARNFVKDLFYTGEGESANTTGLIVIALALIVGGIIFLLIERREAARTQRTTDVDLNNITLRQAVGVGIAQTFALIPGVSRSGASIVGGLLSGLNRQTATAFSFYLAIPMLGGATIIDLLLSLDEITSSEQILNLIVGALVTAVVSWFAIGWLLRYIARNSYVIFGWYRIFAGAVILLLVAVGWLA